MTQDVDQQVTGRRDGTTVPVTTSTTERPARGRAAATAVDLARRLRRAAGRPALRPWLLGATALVFGALVVVSFRALPANRTIRPGLLAVLVLVATPSTLVLNALQYRTMAAALDHRIGLRSAMRVSIVATVVNYLPIPAPGGIAVRTAALARRGSTVRSAVSINAITGVVWAGVAALVAGLALVGDDELAARGGVAAAVGAVAVAGSALLVRRTTARWRRLFAELVATQAGLVVTSGIRVWLSLAAIGQPTSLGAALAISGSTVVAAMVGIAPAGLGLREAIAGGLAAGVGVPVASAVAASALDRVASQAGLLLCAPVTGLRWREVTGGRPAPADVPELP
ncbi:MAG TPA: lysylphosphatidylglycerol synthase domain-containing protein [Acidimicrobiales bacterium]|nr:lysylphosphatidylglycerol synthase domain-containing protein [Acidimicrobiales bacterium]